MPGVVAPPVNDTRVGGPRNPVMWGGDRGQTTAEYALVLPGVAAIALLVVAWARSC